MKRAITVFGLMTFFIAGFSQTTRTANSKNNSLEYRTIQWYNWSDSSAFLYGPSPTLTGYGELSDSLESVYNVDFYEFENEYYAIASWADYYYWFTKKHYYLFRKPIVEYEYYYVTGNDYEMAKFIAGDNFTGKYYPTTFTLNFSDPSIDNKLTDYSRVASNQKEVNKMQRDLIAKKQIYDNNANETGLTRVSMPLRIDGINTNERTTEVAKPIKKSTSSSASINSTSSKKIKLPSN
jgi:hypothetical protein